VLPVALREKGTTFHNGESWRALPDADASTRLRLLLISFLKWCDQATLREFLIVCPESDVFEVSRLVRSITNDSKYKVIPELEMCPEIGPALKANGKLSGWHIQQLIKLVISSRICSEHYVTLDSDIISIEPMSYNSFFSDGRALTNVETADDYRRLYCAQFAEGEIATKALRYAVSAAILGYQRPAALRSRFYGETPVVLHTESVRDLLQFLCNRYPAGWINTLANRLGWTEYGLYFQFLEQTGRLEELCALTGCNTVLDLERSVWQASFKYRMPRNYAADSWFNCAGAHASGLFVAIQSWLTPSSWLPPGCDTVGEFYSRLGKWLAAA
jgi:hypothetical protein